MMQLQRAERWTSVRSGTGGLIGRAGGSPPVLCCEALLPHAKNSFDLTTRASNEEKKEVRGPETPSSSDLILASMTPITCRQTFSSRRWHTHAAEKLVPTKHGVNPLRLNRTICEALSSEWQLLSQMTTRQDVTNLPPFVVFWSIICVMDAECNK